MLIERKYPINFDLKDIEEFQNALKIEIPDPSYCSYSWCIVFKNGIVFNVSGVKNQSLLYDKRFKEIGGNATILKMILIELKKGNIKFINNTIPIATAINEWSNNYFHWLTEVLPRVYFLKTQVYNFTILLPSNYKSDFQLATLKLLEIPIKYYRGMTLVKRLLLPSRLSPYSAHYNPGIIQKLVAEIKSKIDLSFSRGSLIYLTRRNAITRKIANENEVFNVLNDFGFCTIEFESMSFQQQVSVAHNSKLFLSIHGAGLTNIMFCNAGSSVYEFSLKGETMDKCYYTLADACNLKYYYQLCKSPDGNHNYHSADLLVDLQLLRKNLVLILQK